MEPGQVSMRALFENVSQFGSLTGFIDFSPTDSILRFLDEYVMAALPFNDLHSLLIGITGGEVVDLEYPAIVVRGEEAEEESL